MGFGPDIVTAVETGPDGGPPSTGEAPFVFDDDFLDGLNEPPDPAFDPVAFLVFGVVFTALAVGLMFLIRRVTARRPPVGLRPAPSAHAPPGDPAISAFVALDAARVDGQVVAAAVLDLARRGAIQFELAGDGTSRVMVRDLGAGRTEVDRLVLRSISAGVAGEWRQPWEGVRRRSIRRLRRLVTGGGVREGVVENITSEPLLMLVVGPPPWTLLRLSPLVVTAAVWIALLRPALDVVAAVVYVVVLLGVVGALLPWSLTADGERLRTAWMAHARWLEQHGRFADVPPAGVVVWGEHLVHAAVVGLATRAIDELTPPLLRPRTRGWNENLF